MTRTHTRQNRTLVARAGAVVVMALLATSCLHSDLFHQLEAGDCVKEKMAGGISIEGQIERVDCSNVSGNPFDRTYTVRVVGDAAAVDSQCPILRGTIIIDGDYAVCFGW